MLAHVSSLVLTAALCAAAPVINYPDAKLLSLGPAKNVAAVIAQNEDCKFGYLGPVPGGEANPRGLYYSSDARKCFRVLANAFGRVDTLDNLFWLIPTSVETPPQNFGTGVLDQLVFETETDLELAVERIRADPRVNLLLHHGRDPLLIKITDDAVLKEWTSNEDFRYLELVSVVDYAQVSASVNEFGFPEVSDKALERIEDLLDDLTYSPAVNDLLNDLESSEINERYLTYLSGEDQSKTIGNTARMRPFQNETWSTRHSMSTGGARASDWLIALYRSFGLDCEQITYRNGFIPFIECVIEPEVPTNETVIIGAHYDSRGSFGYTTAPGANDDASGTVLLLSIAENVAKNNLSFKKRVVFASFSGEEQGLLSSRYYAPEVIKRGWDTVLMVQSDMIAYRKPGEPSQLALPESIGLTEARYLVGNISTIYTPELVVGTTAVCCSDHQSFVENGLPSTHLFERNGPIADPKYHHSGDTVYRDGFNLEQVLAITKVVYATLLHTAELIV